MARSSLSLHPTKHEGATRQTVPRSVRDKDSGLGNEDRGRETGGCNINRAGRAEGATLRS